MFADLSRFWQIFRPIWAKETPEFFDKIKAGGFTLKFWGSPGKKNFFWFFFVAFLPKRKGRSGKVGIDSA